MDTPKQPPGYHLEQTSPGRLIFLNGASSSGKSTIATALQATLEEPFWHISIDHFREAGILPLDRIRSGEFAWDLMRPKFFEGFHRCIPELAAAGNNLIVEHIVETQEWMSLLKKLLKPFDVFYVGLHCPLAELLRREGARTDKTRPEAGADFEIVHRYMQYDLELDSTRPVDQNVSALLKAWAERQSPPASNGSDHQDPF